MAKFIEHKVVKARKSHSCDGNEQIQEWCNVEKEFGEKYTCKKIKKGDEYYCQKQRHDEGLRYFRSCLTCNEFIKKHCLYSTTFF